MGLLKGGFLRLTQTLLYVLAFCCAAIIVGIYGYFLAVLAGDNLYIPKRWEAVEGLAGAAVLYTILAVLLTCCLSGVTFFSVVGLVLDLLFVGAMIAIAYFSREGANSCRGDIKTPLGNGFYTSKAPGTDVNLRTACKMNTAVFAVAIIGAVVFLLTAIMQILLARSHKKEKRSKNSLSNDYDDGYAGHKRSWRKNTGFTKKDAELGAPGFPTTLATQHPDVRPSGDTGFTGSTVTAPAADAATLGHHNHSNTVDSRGFHGDHAPHVGNGAERVSRTDYRGYT